ncbi:hypothetical protein FDB25_12330 [Clostridium botulinum]|nr:hypothetical protein [Clostridium botulinum]
MNKKKKTTIIANFNCTFGKENKPMLTYFKEIIFPAFTQPYVRTVGDDKYFFKDVQLKELEDKRLVLQGMLIRKTKLEVRTEYDSEAEEIRFTNKFYDTAPISIFTLFLDNHRLLYTTNQKGSPKISSFGATIKDIIKRVVKEYNQTREDNEKIPFPQIDVVDVPSIKSIEEKLDSVKKIRKLKFRFFNPNGDFDTKSTFEWMFNELDEYGSKRGEISINSPTKIDKVKNSVVESKGFAEVKLEVNYNNGAKGNLDNSSLSEKFEMSLPEESSAEAVSRITVNTLKENELIKEIGKNNKEIFEKNKIKVKELLS